MSIAIRVMVAAALCAGCAASTTIKSNRDPAFHDKVAELFVISQVGSDGETSAKRFEDELPRMAKVCDIRLGVSRMSNLELSPDAHLEEMKTFGAKYVLLMKLIGGTTQNGGFVAARYDAQLMEPPTSKLLWRADIELRNNLAGRGDEAATLAWDLLRKLKADGITSPCAELDKMDPSTPPVRRR